MPDTTLKTLTGEHRPAVAQLGATDWGVYCPACSAHARDYVPRCLVQPDGWPPLILREATPSVLIEARARAAADTYQPPGAPT